MKKKFDQNQLWNNHYKDINKIMLWPSEALIRSLNFLKNRFIFKSKSKIKILDYGCGNGRNANLFLNDNYFKKIKFNFFGFDISKNAIKIAKSNIASKKFTFDTNFYFQKYNLILCIAVLDQLISSQRSKLLNDIFNLMNKNSYLILDVLTKNKHIKLQGLGNEIEKDTYILNNQVEKGIFQYFFKSKDIFNLNKKFKIIYEEDYQIKTFIYKKLKKFYTRKLIILKKNA